jgi:SH3 domain-containing YSC84-like protein 1
MKVEDKAIPSDLLSRANCVVIVPGVKKGAFIVGAKYGKGFVTCRNGGRGWSSPAALRMEGGSVGFQIGGSETDVVLLVLNERGADRLMKSEFKLGGEAGVAAGPVGRTATAATDATMRAEMLGYSRARGAFAGISLDGSTLREDLEDNEALYGKKLTTEQIVRGGQGTRPKAAGALLQTLARYSPSETK